MPDIRAKELRVAGVIATRKGDEVRGPAILMHNRDAAARLLNEGELAWVYGAKRHELAEVIFDERVKAGDVVLRDLIVAAPSDTVRVVKPDLDTRDSRFFA